MSASQRASASAAFLALSCVGFAVPAAADGIDAADTQRRVVKDEDGETIIVTGTIEDELESPKATRPLLDTPQTVTVVSNQTIKKQNLLTLRDVLSTVPGITFGAGEGGGGYGDSINLRGYSANNDVTQDGVRDSAQYSRTDPFNTQQIEVYNGANSVFNGSGSIGGTINVVSKRPQAEDMTVLEAGIGTDDYHRATVDSNVRVSDLVAVRLNAMVHQNDVPGRDVERYKRWGVAPSITIGIAAPTSLTLSYFHQEDDNIPVYGVPYYVYEGGLLPGADYSGYYGFRNRDGQEIVVDRLTATFEHAFSDTLYLRNLTRWQGVDQDVTVNPPQGTWCLDRGTQPVTAFGVAPAACPAGLQPGYYRPSGPRGTQRISDNQTLYNQTDLKAVFDTGGLEHTLVVGASFMQEDYDLTQGNAQRNPDGSVPVYDPISIADPDPVYDGPVNFFASSIQQGSLSNKAVYLFDTIAFSPQLELNAGLRYENSRGAFRVDSIATDGGISATTLSDTEDNLFSYRAGLVFKPSPTTSLYAAYGNSETPAMATVRLGCESSRDGNFCDVAPEKAVNYEIGAKADLMGGKLLATAALFRNERTNYRVPSTDPLEPQSQVLDGRARVDGLALGLTGSITRAWQLFANYTWLDSEVLQSVSDECAADPACGDVQAGRPLLATPKHSGSLFTSYTLPFGLQLGYGFTYGGRTVVRNDVVAGPLPYSDDYLTHRLFAAYSFGNGLTAQLNVQNVTDEEYFTNIRTTTGGWAVPGEGRAARLSLFYSF